MRVLVTGGLGFIGSHLVEGCLEEGYEVTIIDDLSTGDLSNGDGFWKEVNIIRGSILDEEALKTTFKHPYNIIFHLAALPNVGRSIEDPIGTAKVNIIGTLNIIERSDSSGAVIIASSSSVYGGWSGGPLKEGRPLNPLSPYAVQKVAMENLSEQYSIHYNDNITCLRFFNVYGPRQRVNSPYAGVIPSFIEAKQTDQRAIIYGDGLQSRDFTYVKDVVSAMLAAADQAYGYNVYNVARGENTSIIDLHKAMGSPHLPIHQEERQGDVFTSQANVEKIKKDLGWSAKYTLSEGLKLFCPK